MSAFGAPEPQSPEPLSPALARRMAPLALLAGLTVGVALPASYERVALGERAAEAALWARTLAGQISGLAEERPLLWADDHARLDEILGPTISEPLQAQIRLDLLGEDAAFVAGRAPARDDVHGYGEVRRAGVVVGRIEVSLAATAIRQAVTRLWWAAAAVGALLAAALWGLPLAAVRRADRRNAGLWAALSDANRTLEARVADRTADLRRREEELAHLGARVVAAQEEERARISRDLHDELGQTLTGLRLRLTTLGGLAQGDPRAADHLSVAEAAVDDAVEHVRRLAHKLRPSALDGIGVGAAIRAHAGRWAEASEVQVELEVEDIEPDAGASEVLFRAAQEALTNVARHAEARRVRLRLGPADDGWRLEVEDDGRGLNPASPRGAQGGLGLIGARERVEQAGGYLDLEPVEPSGLRLVVWLPG